MSDPQMFDVTEVGQYKSQTGTNVRPVKTLNQCKCPMGTSIRKNIGLWLSLKKRPLV